MDIKEPKQINRNVVTTTIEASKTENKVTNTPIDFAIKQKTKKETKEIKAKTVSEMSVEENIQMQVEIQVRAGLKLDSDRASKEIKAMEIIQQLEDSKTKVGQFVGSAAKNFVAMINKEVEQGLYTNLVYSRHIAAAFGGQRVYNINGYLITFIEGQTTKIPNSLYEDALSFIEGVRIDNLPAKLSGVGGNLTSDEQAAISRMSGGHL